MLQLQQNFERLVENIDALKTHVHDIIYYGIPEIAYKKYRRI